MPCLTVIIATFLACFLSGAMLGVSFNKRAAFARARAK
jgi:hypothetical protein